MRIKLFIIILFVILFVFVILPWNSFNRRVSEHENKINMTTDRAVVEVQDSSNTNVTNGGK